tara:strand:+ start:438 stop:1577 length:1140 start_codon:yes stop_codon:yes gene_type:complete
MIKEKIKILYILSTLEKVGPTNQLLYLIKYLDKKVFEPIILTLSPEPENSNYNSFIKENIKVISINLSRLMGFFLIKGRLNKIINELKPDLVQTLGYRSDRVKINIDAPKIIILRTSLKGPKTFLIKPVFLGQMIANMLFRWHLSFVMKNEYVLVCSKSLSEEYFMILKRKYKYIQNGIDNQKYIPSSRKFKKELRCKLSLPLNKKIYISVGKLNPGKNIDFLVSLFSSWEYLKNSILIILGNGVNIKKIRKKVENNKNIKLYGQVDKVISFLQLSDFYISSSKGEGLPNSVLEGMSIGLPCLLSDIPAHNEILKNSNAGLLFKNNNIQDFKKKLKELEKLDFNKLSNNSIKHINKYFSAKIMTKKYQKFYKEVIRYNS